MADLSDAFVALPGGFGTLEEFCEVVTWTQLGLHAKPCGILNVLGFYSPLLRMLDHTVEERFLKPENRALVLAGESPADLLQALEEWRRYTLRNGSAGRRGEWALCSQGRERRTVSTRGSRLSSLTANREFPNRIAPYPPGSTERKWLQRRAWFRRRMTTP
jgi:hypothetical protein